MPPSRTKDALLRSSSCRVRGPRLERGSISEGGYGFTNLPENEDALSELTELSDVNRVRPQPKAGFTRSVSAVAPKAKSSARSMASCVSLSIVIVNGVQLKPSVAFDTFWKFVAERKAIDDRRRAGLPAPWTEDPILQRYFFCNTYRVLDKLTQYIIKEVIEKGPQDPVEVVFRVTLFNTFTKIDTWELLQEKLGPLTWTSYNREKYKSVLNAARKQGMALYTAAFIKPAPHFGYKENHMNHLCLLENLMENEMPYKLLGAPTMADVYEYLISFPGMGDFTTYQLMLNLSYTNVLNFHPNDFTIAGPGAISGLTKLFGTSFTKQYTKDKGFSVEVIRWLAETQNEHFKRLGLSFSGLGPKKLPMDVSDIEHTVCEVDKYCRKAHPHLKAKRKEIRHVYNPNPTPYPRKPALPKAWSHPARRTPRIRETPLVVEKRYTIDKIAKHKLDENGQRMFFVYWEGYSPKDATWEFESSLLQDAPTILKEYLAKENLKPQWL